MTTGTPRRLVAPCYLFICLLVGGSVQTIWLTFSIQLIAVILIAWAILEEPAQPPTKEARQLSSIVLAMVGLVILHILPLPPYIWEHLPGRGIIIDGLRELGLRPGWQPLSLAPYDTITSALALLPPIGMLAAVLLLGAFSRIGLAVATLVAAMLGVGLGVFQVSSSGSTEQFYLQAEHNVGTPSGFFANPNHMATLLLLCLPYLAAVLRSDMNGRTENSRRSVGIRVVVVGGIALVGAGLILSRSFAAIALSIPALMLSSIILVKMPTWAMRATFGMSCFIIVGFILAVAVPPDRILARGEAPSSITTRHDFLSTGIRSARKYFPVGSGVGSFERVYRMDEDLRSIDVSAYVNHAHNDYLEVVIETGVPGSLLIAVFLVWLSKRCYAVLANDRRDPFAVAGAIASFIILAHSIVDYPLRTSAIAVSFAMALSLMVLPRSGAPGRRDVRPTRHVLVT